MKIFLTFLIITYRRPEKVKRLLNLFFDERWVQLDLQKFEIVIADDHSEDSTRETLKPIITSLLEKGWQVRYVYREENLRGDRNLYYGYSRDSQGEFVWFLCDDDMLDVSNAIQYLELVEKTKPVIAISGFEQGEGGMYGNQLGSETKLIRNFSDAVSYIVKYPKTTAYLMRRCEDINMDSVFERWDRTLYSWIGLAIFLLANKVEGVTLIYPPVVARADEDYGTLRYSYRVFVNLYKVTKDSLQLVGGCFANINPFTSATLVLDELTLCLQGLYSHYSWRSPINYEDSILKQEWRFFFQNYFHIFISKQRLFFFLKLVFSFTIKLCFEIFAQLRFFLRRVQEASIRLK